jgi:hypothetical protein
MRALNDSRATAIHKICGVPLFDGGLDIADGSGLIGFMARTDVIDMNPGATAAEPAQAFLVFPDQGTDPRVSEFGTVAGNGHRAFRVLFGHGATACMDVGLRMQPQ